jgi:hypothetical protein
MLLTFNVFIWINGLMGYCLVRYYNTPLIHYFNNPSAEISQNSSAVLFSSFVQNKSYLREKMGFVSLKNSDAMVFYGQNFASPPSRNEVHQHQNHQLPLRIVERFKFIIFPRLILCKIKKLFAAGQFFYSCFAVGVQRICHQFSNIAVF